MRGAANLTSAMEVAADLRRRILRGELKPGARLNLEIDLLARYVERLNAMPT